MAAVPSERMLRSFCCWLLNNGIALSRNRACAALDQFAIFKCELLHVSHSLDDEMDHLQAVFFVCAWAVRLYTLADGVLTMTDSKSAPVRSLSTGEKILHKMRDGDDAAAVARRLTMEIYRMLRDGADDDGLWRGAQLSGVGSGLKISLRCAATTIVCCAVRAQPGEPLPISCIEISQ